ncbi:uncharacterized protein LOC106869701 [Octopus bimaculoides]|uniref:Uncharacterized protein n=1 Tax=Octopus bimaculoides TaxID=37653 RepID=A0A0L8HMS0_OCTBM|nr:uncharacterized protein LOC106869701 [Octopus bimaculoides]|eukprot:XP_014771029.1 PREDICTED: uncharacterized protein LOC106869701 [Octopus bimaculoides]
MAALLFQYIFIVTFLLCIPICHGCLLEAKVNYLECKAFFTEFSNINELRDKLDYICSDKISDKQKILDCQRNATNACDEFSERDFLNGTDVDIYDELNKKFCERKEDVHYSLPCYEKNKVNFNLSVFTEELHKMRQDNNVTTLLTACGIWPFFIENVLKQPLSNCSETLAAVFHEYMTDQLPKRCEVIKNNGSYTTVDYGSSTTVDYGSKTTEHGRDTTIGYGSNKTNAKLRSGTNEGPRAVSNIYLSWLLILSILFATS